MKPIPALRYELKQVAAVHQLPQVLAWVRLHPAGFRLAFPPRRVNSLYLDTPNLNSLRANLIGVSSREKLRLRWYGQELPEIRPVLELKYKSNLLGGKHRFPLPNDLDLTRTWRQIYRQVSSQTPPFWRNIVDQATQPALFNHYQRHYFHTPDGQVRLTIDHSQRAFDQRYGARPNLKYRLPLADSVIIELKADSAQEERLQNLIARLPLPRCRNSKYVNGVLTAL